MIFITLNTVVINFLIFLQMFKFETNNDGNAN